MLICISPHVGETLRGIALIERVEAGFSGIFFSAYAPFSILKHMNHPFGKSWETIGNLRENTLSRLNLFTR